MNSVMQRLVQWTRRASHTAQQKADTVAPITYRICGWPELTDSLRTAPVYRLLSIMSVKALSRCWMLGNSGLAGDQVDQLLDTLQRQHLLQAKASQGAGHGQAHAEGAWASQEAQGIA